MTEKGVFAERFDAGQYIKTYYPDLEDVELLLVAMYLLHTNPAGNYVVDSISDKTKLNRELIENIAIFDFYREVVEQLIDVYLGKPASVLDVGGGPTIYQHIAISLLASHITHAEYLESNRREVLSWLRDERAAHSWDSYFSLVKEFFKYGKLKDILNQAIATGNVERQARALALNRIIDDDGPEIFKQHVRDVIGVDVVHGDVFQSDLGMVSNPLKYYDIVTSNFVVESAALDMRQWEKGMSNLISRIKKGGHFVQTAITNATWYQVGEKKLPATPVNEKIISQELNNLGCEILYQKVLTGSSSQSLGYDGMIFTLAIKR